MLFCELMQFGVPLDVFCELRIFARLMASWSLGADTGAVLGYVLFGVLFGDVVGAIFRDCRRVLGGMQFGVVVQVLFWVSV